MHDPSKTKYNAADGVVTSMEDSAIGITNSIIWGNNEGMFVDGTSSISVNFSNIEGDYPGTNNINLDPLFVDPDNEDYHLQSGSPCIDAATSDDPVPATDKEGNSRYDNPATPNTGSGSNGNYYDMGAYEFPRNGDVNGDGNITPQDALMAFQHYLELIQLDAPLQDRAEVTGDGAVTPADALCIFRKYLELPSCLDQPLDISGSWSGSWVVTAPAGCSGETGPWSVTGLSENNGQIIGEFLITLRQWSNFRHL